MWDLDEFLTWQVSKTFSMGRNALSDWNSLISEIMSKIRGVMGHIKELGLIWVKIILFCFVKKDSIGMKYLLCAGSNFYSKIYTYWNAILFMKISIKPPDFGYFEMLFFGKSKWERSKTTFNFYTTDVWIRILNHKLIIEKDSSNPFRLSLHLIKYIAF